MQWLRFLSAAVDVMGICDVDSEVAADGGAIVAKDHPGPKMFADYRRVLEEKGDRLPLGANRGCFRCVFKTLTRI